MEGAFHALHTNEFFFVCKSPGAYYTRMQMSHLHCNYRTICRAGRDNEDAEITWRNCVRCQFLAEPEIARHFRACNRPIELPIKRPTFVLRSVYGDVNAIRLLRPGSNRDL